MPLATFRRNDQLGEIVIDSPRATAQTPQTFNDTLTSHDVTGLTNGQTYTFKVAAINDVGTGTNSGASNAVTPATIPGGPTIGTATPGNGQSTVTWTAPSDDGGSAITGYVVTPYIGVTAQTPQTFNDTLTSHAVTGLTNGQTYTFSVAAINAVGTGAESGMSNAAVPAVFFASPVSVSTPEDVALNLTLTGSDDGGHNLTFDVVTDPAYGQLGRLGRSTCTRTSPRVCSVSVHYRPDANWNGTDTFVYRVNNGTAWSAPATVTIVVTPVDDAPSIRGLPHDVRVRRNGTVTVPFSVSDPDTPLSSLVITASSSDPAVVPNSGLILGGTAANRTLQITAGGQRGNTTVALSVHDATTTVTTRVTVRVDR